MLNKTKIRKTLTDCKFDPKEDWVKFILDLNSATYPLHRAVEHITSGRVDEIKRAIQLLILWQAQREEERQAKLEAKKGTSK